VCDVAAIGPAVSAIGGAMQAQAANKAARRNYEYQLKVRKRKWMGDRSLYQTKVTQFEQEVDLANVAAQRAYTRTQISLNNAQALAILEDQEGFKKMMQGEGALQASFAERGVGGKGMGRALVMNKANYGMSQAMRSRGLMMAQHKAKRYNEDVNRQLKSSLNKSFSDVAIQPVPDVAPPAPVMQNVGMTLMLGMANAVGEGLAAKDFNSALSNKTNQTTGFTPPPIDPYNPSPGGSGYKLPSFSSGINPYAPGGVPRSNPIQGFY
tara:strand:+ start:99 stop:896 length:798 start_codon:yes stop_codon:yes gene_type:complete